MMMISAFHLAFDKGKVLFIFFLPFLVILEIVAFVIDIVLLGPLICLFERSCSKPFF